MSMNWQGMQMNCLIQHNKQLILFLVCLSNMQKIEVVQKNQTIEKKQLLLKLKAVFCQIIL